MNCTAEKYDPICSSHCTPASQLSYLPASQSLVLRGGGGLKYRVDGLTVDFGGVVVAVVVTVDISFTAGVDCDVLIVLVL